MRWRQIKQDPSPILPWLPVKMKPEWKIQFPAICPGDKFSLQLLQTWKVFYRTAITLVSAAQRQVALCPCTVCQCMNSPLWSGRAGCHTIYAPPSHCLPEGLGCLYLNSPTRAQAALCASSIHISMSIAMTTLALPSTFSSFFYKNILVSITKVFHAREMSTIYNWDWVFAG